MTLPSDHPQDASIDAEGIWNQVLKPAKRADLRPALFLDRDGCVVEEVHYLHRPEETRLIPGAAEVIGLANRRGFPVIMITNQSGIGRGYFGWSEFGAVQTTLFEQLAATGAWFDAIFACPHHAEGAAPYGHPDHPARKPNPGMLLRAADQLPIDLSKSWVVGDRCSDLEAGRNAGLKGGMHVLTGFGPTERDMAKTAGRPQFQALLADSIADALAKIPILGA